MKLIITLKNPVSGYWDGGEKKTFNWEIEKIFGPDETDKHYVARVGSWEVNLFNTINAGIKKQQTSLQILTNLKTRLLRTLIKNKHEVESAIIESKI